MSKIITPSVGRKVWMVNLQILDHYGNPFIVTSVTLLQEGDTPPQGGWLCV